MAAPPTRCPECATEWGPAILACPGCRRLVHRDELERLAREARTGDHAKALVAWRSALALLPHGSKQATRIQSRIAELEAASPVAARSTDGASRVPKWLAGLGAVGLFAWKAKTILLFLLTKAKLLLTGMASWQTVFSMGLAFGVYWAAWGWPFALGLLLSVYVHELGHVVALRRYGIPASAPMFIPGVGAFVRLGAHPATPRQDARVGLAGPWAGLLASLASGALYLATGAEIFLAVARVGAWINLLNLLPVWQLDGGRGFASLSRGQRWLGAAAVLLAWLLSGEMLLGIVGLAAGVRAFVGAAPDQGDRWGLLQYVLLIAAHSALASLEVTSPL